MYGVFDVDDGGIMRHHDRSHMEALFLDFEPLLFEEAVFETMHGHLSQGFCSLMRLPV